MNCQALVSLNKNDDNNKNIYLKVPSAVAVIGALRVN